MPLTSAHVDRLASGFRHPEAPVADADALLFSDVADGGVFRYDEREGVTEYLPHRRGIGGICLHRDGGIIVTGRNVAWKRGKDSVVLLEGEPGETFSDLCADPDGRILVGGLFYDRLGTGEVSRPGCLYRIDTGGAVERVGARTTLPNGMGFSPDGRWLYHSDTTAGVVWRYAVDEAGDLGARTPWIDLGDRWPDGLAVAEDGAVWIALARGGAVAAWSADGHCIGELQLDSAMVTSVCFGGPGLAKLYITTAAAGDGATKDGTLHCADVGIRGARVDAAGTIRRKPV